jgi:putative ABC transport system substrate-binding protein
MEHPPGFLSRRQFVVGAGAAGLGLVAGCGRLPWQAQEPMKVYRIGYLSSVGSQGPANLDAFREGLYDYGWVEGQNIALEVRWAERIDQLPDLATEIVRLPVDIVAAVGDAGVRAARHATSTVPIVMVLSPDPVALGHVASLARPGGNVTGQSLLAPELEAKRLEFLKETAPEISRVAVLWDRGGPPDLQALATHRHAAESLGMQLQFLELRGPEDVSGALEAMERDGAQALHVVPTGLTSRHARQIADFALAARLPTTFGQRDGVVAGGLLSYGVNYAAFYRRAAYYVDRILKGTKPADLPIEQPMTFEFVVNMKTARELGITFPREILLQVTEVIE